MTDQQRTAPERIRTDSSPGRSPETFGARAARISRAQQGLSSSVENAAVLQHLQVLCGQPRLRDYSGTPDELDALRQ